MKRLISTKILNCVSFYLNTAHLEFLVVSVGFNIYKLTVSFIIFMDV